MAQTRGNAVGTVFSIAELLEQILLYLPLTSIIKARRTCCQFNQAFIKSTAVQQALFLMPVKPDTVRWFRADEQWKVHDAALARAPLLNPFVFRYAAGLLCTIIILFANDEIGLEALYHTRADHSTWPNGASACFGRTTRPCLLLLGSSNHVQVHPKAYTARCC